VENYAYAADGLRRSITNPSGTVHLVWDGDNVLLMADQDLVTEARFTDFPGFWGGLVSQRRSGVTSFYAFDILVQIGVNTFRRGG
jgi:hypothetical protein